MEKLLKYLIQHTTGEGVHQGLVRRNAQAEMLNEKYSLARE